MSTLATYYDENRLLHESDRRLHATDMEISGGYIQIVPAVARSIVRSVQETALQWSEGQIAQAIAMQDDPFQKRDLLRQKWWIDEWRRKNGLYRIRNLTKGEREITRYLLGRDGMPSEAFPRAQGNLEDDNDARIVAEVIACNGRMIITSNRVLIERKVLDEWLAKQQNRWPDLTSERLLAEVDPLYTRWWNGHPDGPELMTRIILNAYWPESKDAPRECVIESVTNGVEALRRGHLSEFATLVQERLEKTDTIDREIEHTRRNLLTRTRQAERRRKAILDEDQADRSEAISVEPERDEHGRFEWGG